MPIAIPIPRDAGLRLLLEKLFVAEGFHGIEAGCLGCGIDAEDQTYGNGDQKRDFVYVEDVAFANYRWMEGPIGTYNLATGKSRSVNEVLLEIERYFEVVGFKWDHTNKPDPRGSVYINTSKAKRELGLHLSTPLQTGIPATIKWWENQRKTI